MWQEFKFTYTVEFLENPDNVASLVEKAVQKASENTATTKCKQMELDEVGLGREGSLTGRIG